MRRQRPYGGRQVGSGATEVVGSKLVALACPLVLARLRLPSGTAALRVKAVVEEPHGTAGGPSGGGDGRPARPSSIRWARRQRMLASEPRPGAGEDDLIELNVGGRLMQTTRSTLLQVSGSRLAGLFRKGAEADLSYDSGGRVWLDLDPTLFQLVLRYLREVKMNGGHRRGCLPAVQPADEAPFRRLLSYLGVLPYAGATIPLAVCHDPLTDELLPSPQPVRPPPAAPTPPADTASPLSAAQLTAAQLGSVQHPQRQGRGKSPRRQQPRVPLVDSQAESCPLASGGAAAADRQELLGVDSGGGAHSRGMHLGGGDSADAGGGGVGEREVARRQEPGLAAKHRQQPAPPRRSEWPRPRQARRAPEVQVESEDLIPDTATYSILSNREEGSCGSGQQAATPRSGLSQQGESAPKPRRQPSSAPSLGGASSTGGPAARLTTAAASSASPGASESPPAAAGKGAADRAVEKLSPPPTRAATGVSQLFYISTDFSEARGLRVSVHTEKDISGGFGAAASGSGAAAGGAGTASEPFDIFIDATYSESQLSLTFVSRRELLPGGVFLGLTSRAQLDRKGAQIPCYGWKSNGCTYNDHTGGGRLGGGGSDAACVKVGASLGGSTGRAGQMGAGREQAELPELLSFDGATGIQSLTEMDQPLWKKGDSVELIMRQGRQHNQLLLKVNGRAIDVINRLPSFRNWGWYVGMWAGGDISCAVFQRDQYAVYWGDYAVKRYL